MKRGVLIILLFLLGIMLDRAFFPRLSATKPPELIAKAGVSPSARKFSKSQPVFVWQNWSDQLKQTQQVPESLRYYEFVNLAWQVPVGSEKEAMALAKKMMKNPALAEFINSLLDIWVQRNPAQVLEYVQTIKDSLKRNEITGKAVKEWAKMNSTAAEAWIASQPNGPNKQNLLVSLIEGLAEKDPQQALEKTKELPGDLRRNTQAKVLRKMAETAPQTAADLAMKNNMVYRPWEQGSPLDSVLLTWMANDPAAVSEWFNNLSLAQKSRKLVLDALVECCRSHPVLALSLMEQLPASFEKKISISNSASSLGLSELNEWMPSIQDPWVKDLAQARYAAILGSTDPKAAVELISKLPVDPLITMRYIELYSAYARQDPQAALAQASQIENLPARNEAMRGVFQSWTADNPKEAAAAAERLPEGPAKNQALQSLAEQWPQHDPQAALQWMEQQPNPALLQNSLVRIVRLTMIDSPEKAAEVLGSLPAQINATEATTVLANSWLQQDPKAVVNWVKTLPDGSPKTAALKEITYDWARYDTADAAAFASSLAPGELKNSMFRAIAMEWAWHNPPAAAEFARDLPPDASRQQYIDALLGNFIWRDPEGAARFATSLTDSGRETAIESVADRWSNRDPANALQWAQTLPEGSERASAMAKVLGNWAEQNPQAAGNFVAGLSGEEQERGVKSVVDKIAGADPAYAAKWIDTFPSGATRDQAAESLMQHWAGSDPQGASAWLSKLPQDQSRDGAIAQFAQNAAGTAPNLAWQWAAQIGDSARQQQTLLQTAQKWFQINAGEAAAAIQASNYSDDFKAKLLQTRR